MCDGPDQEARDALFLSQLGKDLKGPFPSRWTCPQVQPWLYGYDAYEVVESAVTMNPFPLLANNEGDGSSESGWISKLARWSSPFSGFHFLRVQR
jgi:salicylate hydroxylase